MRVQFLSREDPLEEGMATHSSILAWIITWAEELGGIQSIGLQELDRPDLVTKPPPPFNYNGFNILNPKFFGVL